jgi:hypothetical protein
MNGATAEPPPTTSNTPMKIKSKMTGVSHHFLRSRMNVYRSLMNSIGLYIFLIADNNRTREQDFRDCQDLDDCFPNGMILRMI